jgi:uncharacterized GH25 family protein
LVAGRVVAHDTWVETNTNLIRTGDAVYVDLKLGNHGNDHRDFKLASKIDLDACTLEVISPDGKAYDLKSRLVDTGYAPTEGYWKAKFVAAKPGVYTVAHTLDKIVNHGHPVLAVKSGKTLFVVSPTLDKVEPAKSGFENPLGHALEIVPQVNPVTPMGPGQPISVRVLLKGKPLADARVSFVPRSQTLKGGFDEQYERMTNAKGDAEFTPKTGDQFLIVVHHLAKDEIGKDYDETAYSATLSVFVPEICPCCGQ